MKKTIVRVLLGLLGLVVVVAAGLGIYVATKTSAFDASMEKVYDVPLPAVTRSTDPVVLARGKHLVESLGACSVSDCHGSDLSGGKSLVLGPIGTFQAPNITAGGLGAAYSDAELVRLVKHGIKKDGRSLRFMPAQEMAWLPESDVVAMVSYIRTMPAVDKPNGAIKVGVLGKVLDQRDAFHLDVARRIDHTKSVQAFPSPTAEYGSHIAETCKGCHGAQLSGGRIPGAPGDLPLPLNLTPHETGLKDWSYDDFQKLFRTGVRKNGQKLHPFMPLAAFGKMDEIELKALYEYLHSAPAVALGNR